MTTNQKSSEWLLLFSPQLLRPYRAQELVYLAINGFIRSHTALVPHPKFTMAA